jgi:hypothetical protein
MSSVTVQVPPIGVSSLFLFKRPFSSYVRSVLNINVDEVKLKVISVVSMKDMISIEKIDPFIKYYIPVGVVESDFKLDLDNDVPILTLLYNEINVVKVPLSYISFYRAIAQIEYTNKMVIVDVGKLPMKLDLAVHFEGLKDFIETRVGVRPEVKEVSLGSTVYTSAEHELKEGTREAVITVHDTNETKLQKLSVAYNELLARFNNYRATHP